MQPLPVSQQARQRWDGPSALAQIAASVLLVDGSVLDHDGGGHSLVARRRRSACGAATDPRPRAARRDRGLRAQFDPVYYTLLPEPLIRTGLKVAIRAIRR